jgi:DMSO/TMAO reductase YedYZ molybdopterin-dependent catalytic subunit
MNKTRRSWSIGIVALSIAATAAGVVARAQTPAPSGDAAAALVVKGAVKQELHLALADLKAMPRTKVSAKGHDGSTHEYEGVTLASLLSKAGAPQAGDLRGKSMSLCVVAEGSDGYRTAFSLAELDADFAAESVLVADTADGKDLGADQGPLRLVVPGDKRQGRWVRLLKSLSIRERSPHSRVLSRAVTVRPPNTPTKPVGNTTQLFSILHLVSPCYFVTIQSYRSQFQNRAILWT